MLSVTIPTASGTGGLASDGVLRGTIAQSTLGTALNGTSLAANVYAVRKEGGAPYTVTDVSSESVANTLNSLLPWGLTAAMSVEDGLYLACEEEVTAIYVHVTTAGVWAGTGLAVYDSVDGISAGRLLAGVVDASDGFRATAGVYKISLPTRETPSVAFSPLPGDVASRKYVLLKPDGLTAVTTAPAIQRVWLEKAAADVVHVDVTAIANAATDNVTFAAEATTTFPVLGDALLFALPFTAVGVDLWMHRKLAADVTNTWEYLAGDGTWTAFSGVVDGSNGLRNGPTTLGASPTAYTVRWTVPTDWASMPFTPSSGTPASAYWLRLRTSAVTANSNVSAPLWRARARVLGEANSCGLYHAEAASYTSLAYEVDGTVQSADLSLLLVNSESGECRTVTLPADTGASASITEGRLSFTALSVAAGQSLILMHSGGGTATSVQLYLS